MTERKTSLPDIIKYTFDLGKNGKFPEHHVCEYQQCQNTCNGNIEIGRSKQMKKECGICSCFLYKPGKYPSLQQ